MLGLMELREVAQIAGNDAEARRRELVKELQGHVEALGAYGPDHMLVNKAKALLHEVMQPEEDG